MIRKVISCLLIIIMLFSITVNAETREVTKELLDVGFKKTLDNVNDGSTSPITHSVKDNVVEFYYNNTVYKLNYTLTEDPTFTFEMTVPKGISYDDFKIVEECMQSFPLYGYAAYANAKNDVDPENTLAYYLLTMLSNLGSLSSNMNNSVVIMKSGVRDAVNKPNVFYEDTFGNDVIDYLKIMYAEKKEYKDAKELNSYVQTIESEIIDDNIGKLISKMVIDKDVDLSGIDTYINDLKDDINKEFNEAKEKAEFKIELYVGQVCNFQTKDNITGRSFSSIPSDVLDFETDDYKTIKGVAVGEALLTFYIGNSLEKTVYVNIVENKTNTYNAPKTVVLQEGVKDDENNDNTNTIVKDDSSGMVVPTNKVVQPNTPNEVTNAVTQGVNTLPKAGYGFNVIQVIGILVISLTICIVIFIKKVYDIKNVK